MSLFSLAQLLNLFNNKGSKELMEAESGGETAGTVLSDSFLR